ncbi:MAG: PLP-dependent threonine dehydratase [Gammaproteobacteria bacterium RIFCSPLOWO2_02_FULL_61_13]|nr:MAG: PLP-dependent threonine dehydratase [Gammaproteobacteria bacterium RIFCSPLOWO2_02_FULL_61_13]
MFPEYQSLITEAGSRVYDVARVTALDLAPQLSRLLGNRIWLKREDQQPVFSYKVRGAYNMLATLTAAEKGRGVIAASAGNHAQGVALAAQHLGVSALIVMPKTTPEIKINAVRRLNADVVLHGNTYDEAKLHAEELAAGSGRTLIPPYDHPLVIAGQATVAVEILQQSKTLPRYVFVPVGGGGLIAGIACCIKQAHPGIHIIGVESDEAPSMHAAFAAGRPVELPYIGIFADGAAVRRVGDETFRVCRALVDEILLVTNDEICAAVKDIFEDTRAIPEPAGALALAGLKQFVAAHHLRDADLVAIFSGANVNFDRLRHIAELAALGEQREALICITIPERPGSFRALCHDLGARQITEFNYRYSDSSEARVFAGIQLRHGLEEKAALLQALADRGYDVVDMSDNELAKMHVRYMVGGHAPTAADEVLYRFEFPERSGALLQFLSRMGDRWNISLFHYRNHGAAYGRVLMGIQVPVAERAEFRAFLANLDMVFTEETGNPAYRMFLM